MEALRSGQSLRGRPFKQNTIADQIVILKGFLFWLIEKEYYDLPEKKIRRIKNFSQGFHDQKAALGSKGESLRGDFRSGRVYRGREMERESAPRIRDKGIIKPTQFSDDFLLKLYTHFR